MAEWKKIIVSGSNADLADVSASGNFLGNLIGNATGDLTGNADTATALANARTINGTSFDGTGNITLGNDSVTNAMMADDAIDSDQIAANAVTTAKITDANVTLAKIANAAANTVIVRDANSSGVLSAKALATTEILIGDGTGFTAAALSGDVTMTNAGAVTIANNAVETAMIADEQVTLAKLAHAAANTVLVRDANSAGDPSFKAVTNTQILIGDGTGFTAAALSGDVTMTNAGAVTIANGAVETAMIADNAVDGDKLADSFTVANSVAAKNFTASMGVSASHFSASGDIISAGNFVATSGSFVGNGGELTGVVIDIDSLNALGGTGLHQSQDHFVFSDNGTEKKITFSNLEDAIFGNVSGDATVAAGGALTIAATSVEGSMLNNNIVSGLTDIGAAIAATDEIIISDAGTIRRTDVSRLGTFLAGDGLAVSSGVLAVGVDDSSIEISSDALRVKAAGITNAMLADNAADTDEIADNAVTLAKMAGLARGKIIHGDSSGDPAALAAGSANTVLQSDGTDISYGTIATNMIANDAVTGDKLANDITIANDLTVTRDLIVNGTSVTVNTANLNVEDPFILLKSGSSDTSDSGIIFGGSTGTANTGKALVWDASYNSNDGRLAVSTTAVAGDATANFDGSGTAGYYVAGVFAGSESDAATAKADHAGNIRIESSEIYIYV